MAPLSGLHVVGSFTLSRVLIAPAFGSSSTSQVLWMRKGSILGTFLDGIFLFIPLFFRFLINLPNRFEQIRMDRIVHSEM